MKRREDSLRHVDTAMPSRTSHKAAKRPPHAHHGAGRGASRGVSKSAVTKSGRGRGRGAAPGRALAAATAAVTAAARGHGGASSLAGSSSLAFAELAYDPFAAELVALICELVEARGGRASLVELGSALREAAPRRGLRAEAEGKIKTLSKWVKSQGGWDVFVRRHAKDRLELRDGEMSLLQRGADADDSVVEAPARAPAPTRAEVNAMDFLAARLEDGS